MGIPEKSAVKTPSIDPKGALLSLLNAVVPFRFLPNEEKRLLLDEMYLVKAAPFQVILREGGSDKEVYLLEEGQVEQMFDDSPTVKPANVIRSGHYFGERAALLDMNRTHNHRAITPVSCWALPGARFLKLIAEYEIFAQSFGNILRDKHGIFLPLSHFVTEVSRCMAKGWLPLYKLRELYLALEPALHPLANDPKALDCGALSYAVRRLPANVTATYSWFLTDDIPAAYHHPEDLFPAIPTEVRRRNVWEMHGGKNMVLLRNGVSDILDLVSCLCLLSVEAKKIRHRIQSEDLIKRFQDFFRLRDLNGALSRTTPSGDPPPDPKAFLESLPLSEAEGEGLWKIWKEKTVERLYELVLHHEDFNLAVERQLHNYNSRRSEKWILQISKAVRKLLGRDVGELDTGLEVHIISSNTHSVTNCLSPHWGPLVPEILAWARRSAHPYTQESWEVDEDLAYGLLKDFTLAWPERVPTPEDEFGWGVLRLKDTASTGITVQLVDCRKLAGRSLDPGLSPIPGNRDLLIVNIDYAFGEQADEILRNLITLFHGHIRSVNILGKAGALTGQRGGILVPTAFIKQSEDMFQPLPPVNQAELASLRKRLKTIQFTTGPLLTVEGTLLQNRALLNFYRNIWKCVGLEMEGFYYARQVIESEQMGVLRPAVAQRYYYYVSDLPLERGANLSQPLGPSEGIPPLYAVTREVLSRIFEEGSGEALS